MKNLLTKLFVGPFHDPHRYVNPAIKNQWINIKKIWNNSEATTFGIERMFRLFLGFSAYAFPGLYIRHYSGKRGLLSRKLALEIYVSLKLFFPALVLICGLYDYRVVQIAAIYLGVETMLYVLSLLFLSDIFKAPISNKRSYLMVMMNYVELCLDFAILYIGLDLIKNLVTPIDAVYFSFITAMTVGYGDMSPISSTGKILAAAQSMCSLLLITLVVARVINAFNDNYATSSEKKLTG